MLIRNTTAFTSGCFFQNTDVLVIGHTIAAIGENLPEHAEGTVDGTGKFLLPGLIDVHSHGCVGYDACDGDVGGYGKMADFYASKGVTSHLFTTMTLEEKHLCELLEKITDFINTPHSGAYAHGIYLEGPYINPCKKGAQAEKYIIPPSMESFRKLQRAAKNQIRVAVTAPEMPGSMEFIREASRECAVSIAHTTANYDTAAQAFQNGATDVTHLFNAMPPLHHRDPGVIGAALDCSAAFMEMICDGIHLHPSIVRNIFKAAGDRVVLISDSMQATAMPAGQYTLGGQEVLVQENGKATLQDGTIAGSTANLWDCMTNCIHFGVPVEQAIRAATINPAKLAGVDHATGSITVGKMADMVLCDQNFQVEQVFVKGVSTTSKNS